jgi:hypothetical protein
MDSEPLLNRAGALHFCTLYYCVQKRREANLVSKYRRFGLLEFTRKTKQGWEENVITRASAAERRVRRCSAPSQHLLKPLFWGKKPLITTVRAQGLV